MIKNPPATESTVRRRAFEAWTVDLPAAFAETFVAEDHYWHAYDEHRSVSLSSIVITEQGDPVSADRILERVEPLEGSPVDQTPPGLHGRATTRAAPRFAKASRILSGVLATDGRVLLVTITSDDPDWAMRVWLSIRSLPAPIEPFTRGRNGTAARGRWAH